MLYNEIQDERWPITIALHAPRGKVSLKQYSYNKFNVTDVVIQLMLAYEYIRYTIKRYNNNNKQRLQQIIWLSIIYVGFR